MDRSMTHMDNFLRDFDDNSQCLSPEKVYYLAYGAATLTSGTKTAVMTVKHSVLLHAGYIQQQQYGVLRPLPRDGFVALYSRQRAR